MIVNKRGNPCPKCLPFCGKVLIDDVWSGGSKKDGNYPLMSYAIQCGLYHPRCRDVHSTYFPGISRSDDTWTKEELEAIGIKSKEEAKQQYAKRQAEKFGRLAEFSLDEDNKRIYQSRAEQWEVVKEQSFRTKDGGSYGVNWKTVKSKEYTERFNVLSDSEKANSLAAKRSRNALANRTGKNTEEIYAISLTTGKDISSITDQHIPFGVKKTDKFINDVARAEKNGEKILLIHNHPRGLPPSVEDLNELLTHSNTVGITAGHDGSIYYYSKPSSEITEFDFTVAFRKNKQYNGYEQYEKAMEELAKQFDFEFRRL